MDAPMMVPATIAVAFSLVSGRANSAIERTLHCLMRRLSLCAVLLMLSAAVQATVILPIEFRELVATSSAIVHAHVTDVRSAYVDGRRSIETFVTIAADEYYKGNLGEHVTFLVPGGEIGRYRTIFIGAPQFHEGDEVVLFLKSAGGMPYVVG